MITFLDGKIEEKHPTRVVMNVGGVGYEVLIPLSSYNKLPGAGDGCRILTYDHIREGVHQLFGFMDELERGMFVLLMSITGIGPKLALSALSGLTVRDLRTAIAGGDIKRLTSISGVGKKVAERMVVELRDRVAEGLCDGEGLISDDLGDVRISDAASALVSLGFKRDVAIKMVKSAVGKANADYSAEDLIKTSLAGG
jgi:Holliday junction DNA helicase RuvA